ncbi:MAG: NADH-quinone oxidoreductase subunit NuoG, partial [bacterium]|nr:NADH-quinone oxidoreductase subunit NuoG [bacterium]
KEKAESTPVTMVTLTIDDQSVTVPKGTTVLEAARSVGIDIPTFCWHPKLKAVGACRICYVEIEKLPKLQVSCATEAMEGMVVYTNSEQVKQGRKAIIEFILLNHPLDCPTCDKGGECDLQNLTFEHGTDDSRNDFRKARFREDEMTTTFDDKKIGPEIVLNRNRCILCYKCVRSNKEAFGEYDLGVYERGNIAQIDSAPGEQVDNPFSGNLVEICPVGALTNSDWRYKIRVWLTETVPSVDNFLSSGCNITFFKERQKNKIYRTTSRPNDDVDDGWLPDIVRYGYQIVNSPDRLKKPLVKKSGTQVEVSWEEALDTIANRLTEIKDSKGSVCIGGLAAPSLDNRSLYSFSKFFRKVLQSNNVDYRSDCRMLPSSADALCARLAMQPFSIKEIDDSDVIVVFGSDLIREHHNEYLRMRKAYNFNGSRIFSLNPFAVKSADIAELELIYKAGKEEIALQAVCQAAIEERLVDEQAAAKFKNELGNAGLPELCADAGIPVESVRQLAQALASGKKISFVAGEIVTRSRERETIAAAICNLNKLFGLQNKGQVAILARYANSKGAQKLGVMPTPPKALAEKLGSLWSEMPAGEAHNTDAMLALLKKEEIDGLFVMGANPMMIYPDLQFAREGLDRADFLVACDLFETETTQMADVVLPLCSWAEYDGGYVNLEGRNQTARAAIKPIGASRTGFDIIADLASRFDAAKLFDRETIESEISQLLSLTEFPALPTEFCSIKATEDKVEENFDLPLYLCDDPHHSGHLTEKSPSLTEFSGEAYAEISAALAAKMNLKPGESVRVESPVGKIIVPVKISEILNTEVVLLPRNFSSTPTNGLMMRKKRVDMVKLSKVDG